MTWFWRPVSLALVCAVVALAVPAAAATPSRHDNRVSQTEYRAVTRGMTPAEIGEVLHHAHFRGSDAGEDCRARYYRGWDAEHSTVLIGFQGRRVFMKTTYPRHESGGFSCGSSPARP